MPLYSLTPTPHNIFIARQPCYRPSVCLSHGWISQQESRAAARKPRDAKAILFGLKFASDNLP